MTTRGLNSRQRLETRFTRLVGGRHPVMQEGLGALKTVHLAAAGAKLLRGYIEEACVLTDGILAVNVPVGADKSTGKVLPFSAAYVQAVVDAVRDPGIATRLCVITTSAGAPGAARAMIADSGLIHLHKVGGTAQAIRAEQDVSMR